MKIINNIQAYCQDWINYFLFIRGKQQNAKNKKMKNTHSSIVFPLFISKTDVALVINTGHKSHPIDVRSLHPCWLSGFLLFMWTLIASVIFWSRPLNHRAAQHTQGIFLLSGYTLSSAVRISGHIKLAVNSFSYRGFPTRIHMRDVVLAASDQSQLCIRIPAVDQLILQRELYNSKNMKKLNTAQQREWKSTLVLIVLSYYNKKQHQLWKLQLCHQNMGKSDGL